MFTLRENALIRLRDGILTRAEVRATILWRVWWEDFRYIAVLGVAILGTFIGVLSMIVAMIAVIIQIS